MNLKSIIAACTIITLICPSFAYAQVPSPEPDEQDQVSKISPMRMGDTAPFSGVLFSPKATATVITEIETFDERMRLEVDKAVRDVIAKKQYEINETTSKCTTEKSVLQADIDAKSKHITKLTKDLEIAQNEIANAPSRLVWAGVGVAIGAATAILITFAVNQASK